MGGGGCADFKTAYGFFNYPATTNKSNQLIYTPYCLPNVQPQNDCCQNQIAIGNGAGGCISQRKAMAEKSKATLERSSFPSPQDEVEGINLDDITSFMASYKESEGLFSNSVWSWDDNSSHTL